MYKNDIKFKRPDMEVECITSVVNSFMTKLMTAVEDEEPMLEISQQYLVGSMAE